MHRLRPDAGSSLADGVLVETHLQARLLGLRLLRVDGVVVMSPGRLESGPATDTVPADGLPVRGEVGADLSEAARLLAETGSRLRRPGQ